jgi:hypothetical protein
MVYHSTKTLLCSIIQSPNAGDEAAWDDVVELGKVCVYEMSQMTRQSYQPCRKDYNQWPSRLPDSEKGIEAMPHVKAMMRAVRHRDQVTALESAKAALAAM